MLINNWLFYDSGVDYNDIKMKYYRIIINIYINLIDLELQKIIKPDYNYLLNYINIILKYYYK